MVDKRHAGDYVIIHAQLLGSTQQRENDKTMTIATTHMNLIAHLGNMRPTLVVRQGFAVPAIRFVALGWLGFAQEQNIEPDTTTVLGGSR